MTARMLTAVLAAALCLLAAAPAALASVPVFKLAVTSQPTNFLPGSEPVQNQAFSPEAPMPQYSVIATNIGLATTSAPIVLSIDLPPDLTPTTAPIPPVANDTNGGLKTAANELPCSVSGQTVTCTDPNPVRPGQWVQMHVPVKVDANAPETLTGQVSVKGGGAPAEASTSITTTVSEELAPFAFLSGPAGFSAVATAPDGTPAGQAGSHPSQLSFDFGLPTREFGGGTGAAQPTSVSHPKDIRTTLPRGMVVNPGAIPTRCTEAQLNNETLGGCPVDSQVGVIYTKTSTGGGLLPSQSPLYDMVPPPGAPAELGFNAVNVGIFVHLIGRLNSAGEYELGADSSNLLARQLNPVMGAEVQLWGNPSDVSHDTMRGTPCEGTICTIPVERLNAPFLTMPSSCRSALSLDAHADSWEEPTHDVSAVAVLEDPSNGAPVATEGCNALEFEPTIESKPTTDLAESPSGLDFNLHQRQNPESADLATAPVKDLTVALPQGMTLNPSAAAGLEGCSTQQIGLSTAIGQSPIHFNEDPPTCPDASRLGTLEVTTPVLAKYDSDNKIELDAEGKPILDPLPGAVYLAKPFDNPFNSLLAIYLTVEDPETGVIVKVPAKITADPQTGQLVTTVRESPELPIEDVDVHFFGGARGPLITPPLCGNHTTTTTLTPWSAPEGQDAHPASSFATATFPGGGNCPTSAGQAPNSPSFDAGTIAPVAGAYSPFVIKLNREDGSQRLTGVSATLPPGLIGKLAGVTQCSEAQIAAAKAREVLNEGVLEQSSPSCPASSEVGALDVSAGAGPTPFHVGGRAYLSGPYKGAPLSLTLITPGVAGPFDLGAVVLRVALNLDPQRAQIHAVSDPFPTVLEGIPLDVRGASLKLGRPDFTLNPTSCDPMAIEALTSTVPGQIASLRSPFQVGGCSGLGFKPGLALQLKGRDTKRGGHPGLLATYRPRPGDANLSGLVVRLPRSAFLDQAHIRTICTRVQFAAKSCPPAAQYGYIKAWTPLLEEPLEGPVWLRSSNHKLPDLVFDLHGIVNVEVATRIDSSHGGIRARVESAPDAPLTKVVLRMQGAKKGLIINSRNLCGGPNKANVQFTGHNGKQSSAHPVMQADCRGKHKHKHASH